MLSITMVLLGLFILLFASLAMLGWQFLYLIYLDRIGNDRRLRIHELEIDNRQISERLRKAESQLSETKKDEEANSETSDEVWADVIGEN